jgi:hypothetical protein
MTRRCFLSILLKKEKGRPHSERLRLIKTQRAKPGRLIDTGQLSTMANQLPENVIALKVA